MKKTLLKLDLQLFAEGGAEGQGTGAESRAAAGNTGENDQAAADDRAAKYKQFKEDYKAEFDSDVQTMIKGRLKKASENEKAAQDYRNKTQKIFDTLGVKYDIDSSDVDSILEAFENDDSYFEDKALEAGMETDAFRKMKNIEIENRQHREREAAEQERQRQDEIYQRLMTQAEETRTVYPQFDINAEMSNDQFRFLAERGVDLKTAYEIIHKDEVIAGAMRYAAEQTAQKFNQSASRNAARPDENINSQGGAVKTKVDINSMSLKDLESYADKARNGERITFQS